MLTKEKLQQIQRLVKRGMPEGEVKDQLQQEGYTEEEIREIFKPKPYDMRSWYLVFGILITLLGTYVVILSGSFLIVILGSLLLSFYYREENKYSKQKRSGDR